jgi:hypothetical protein
MRARSFWPFPPAPLRTGRATFEASGSLVSLFPISVLDNVQDRFGCSHLAYRCVLSMGNLPHFALGLLLFLYARVDGFPVR